MTSKHLLSIGFLVIALTCTVPGLGAASSHKANLQVSATVTPWFKAQAIQQTRSYQVTLEDIKKGYTDLTAAVAVQVHLSTAPLHAKHRALIRTPFLPLTNASPGR